MDKPGVKARKVAVDVLTRVTKSAAYSNIALDSALSKAKMEARDSAFATALVQGVLRHKQSIDQTIAALSSQPPDKIKEPVLNILRISIFQIDQMPDLPPRAVVDTACDIARAVAHAGVVKFVNAVLRNHLRNRESGGETAETASLAVRYSMPDWLVARWLANFGEEETQAILEVCQKPQALTIRVNDMVVETPAYQKLLEKVGIVTRRSPLVRTCLIVEEQKERRRIEEWPGFAEGLFIVQDESAAFVSQVLAPKAGEQVLDLCAAPGGKTINMAELMEGKGKVTAVDKNDKRLKLLKENRTRLGLRNIETVCADGRTYRHEPVDRVLVDAPCSGTGVIGKRSDLRENRKEEDLTNLVKLQKALLANAATMVKPGGTLVYSTCSIEKEEGFEVVSDFLSTNRDFALAPINDALTADAIRHFDIASDVERGEVMFSPGKHGIAGFYIARMRRNIMQ